MTFALVCIAVYCALQSLANPLYEKYGFWKLCTFPHFFKIDGEYIDFDLMNLELNDGCD